MQARHGARIEKPKVLVIGNHPAVVVSLRTLLSIRNLHVVATNEPEVALQTVEAPGAEIRLVLVDVNTVAMDPQALGARLCEINPNLKILYFSSLVDGEVIRLGIIDPARNVLRLDGVIAAIEEALAPAAPLKTMAAGRLWEPTAN